MQCYQPMDGTDELDGLAIRTLVGHHFWNRQTCCGFLNRCLQSCGQWNAACRVVVEQAVVLAITGDLKG